MFAFYAGKLNSNQSIGDLDKKIKNNQLLDDLDPKEKAAWIERINVTLGSSDNANIDRVPNAGKIENGLLVMHNGLKVDPLSYYGLAPLSLLIQNKGVHEPQEEYIFSKVLPHIPEKGVMLELGSYWSFYSMWFNQIVKNAQCFMIEPEYPNMRFGKKNFKRNGMNGVFYQAFIGEKSFITHKGERFVNVDDFVKDNNIGFVDLLHSDIQGFEHNMLLGAQHLFEKKKVGFVFISTHSNKIHEQCLAFLKKHDFSIIADANLDESFSADGIIAAKAPYVKGIDKLEISKRKSFQNAG